MPQNAKPASLKNIAFDTGVLMERQRIIKILENSYLLGEAHPNYLAKLIALIEEKEENG